MTATVVHSTVILECCYNLKYAKEVLQKLTAPKV